MLFLCLGSQPCLLLLSFLCAGLLWPVYFLKKKKEKKKDMGRGDAVHGGVRDGYVCDFGCGGDVSMIDYYIVWVLFVVGFMGNFVMIIATETIRKGRKITVKKQFLKKKL